MGRELKGPAHGNGAARCSFRLLGAAVTACPYLLLVLSLRSGNVEANNGCCTEVPFNRFRVTVPGHQSSLGSSRPHEALGAWQAFGVEFVLSFLLASTVFASRDPSRSHLGGDAVVIGFAYLACTLAGLPATGASMNPARSLGPAFVMNKWIDHWV
ncbi:unnamed protein product, partial [Ixodes pacificus]